MNYANETERSSDIKIGFNVIGDIEGLRRLKDVKHCTYLIAYGLQRMTSMQESF